MARTTESGNEKGCKLVCLSEVFENCLIFIYILSLHRQLLVQKIQRSKEPKVKTIQVEWHCIHQSRNTQVGK